MASSASISACASAISCSTSSKSASRICAGFGGREAFQRGEQEGLARARRDAHQPLRGVVGAGAVVVLRGSRAGRRRCTRWRGTRDRARPAGVRSASSDALAGGQRLQRDADIVVAGGLVAGEGAGVAAHIGQMRRKPG